MRGALETLAIVHLTATGLMAGVIWYVQIVGYPIFAQVGPAGFGRYHAEHATRTARVVIPAMLVEAASAAGLAVLAPGMATALSLFLLLVVWASTFAVQVPLHRRLSRGWDAAAARRLVATNWLRTLAWSARFGLACAILLRIRAENIG